MGYLNSMSGQLKSQITRNDSISTVYSGLNVFRTPVIRIPVWFDKFSATYSLVFPMEIIITYYYYYYYYYYTVRYSIFALGNLHQH